ncbi:MAG TPA: YbaK/EbsC family protein [Bacillota bacterium]|nr:YbaK/EbsC family protein [Bacillota bacterium]
MNHQPEQGQLQQQQQLLNSQNAQKIQSVLDQYGLKLTVIEFAASTRTAKDAAEAIGCEVAQIAKSLIFRGKNTQKPVLVITSGANRVNESKLREYAGEAIEKADPEFVLLHTGYPIGGVPPIGHATEIEPFIDEDLLQYGAIWAAAGTPNAVFQLAPADLLKITKGQVISVK